MPLTIAVIAGGGFQGQGILDAVHAMPGARAVVVDSTSDAPGELFADHYVVAPPLDQATFDDFLCDLVRAENVDLVVPSTQRELRRLANLSARLSAIGVLAAVCPASLLDILLDKQILYEAFAELGLSSQSPLPLASCAVFPIFGRVRSGWGGRDAIVIRSSEDLASHDIDSLSKSHLWVPWLDGFEEFSADFAIDFRGRLSPLTLRRRVRTSGGFAVVSDSCRDERLYRLVERVADWLVERKGRGIFNVQVLHTADGQLHVSDVNPRHGTSATHALAEGNNLVAFLLGVESHRTLRPVRTVRSLDQHSMPHFELRGIRGVAFDLDDTLIDHKRWIYDRMERAVDGLAADVDTANVMLHTYLALEEGEHARLIDVVTDRLGLPALHAPLLSAYRAALPERASVFPEVCDVLKTLKKQGLKLALITDNPPDAQRAKLAAAGSLRELFDGEIFSREQGAEKPDRAPFDAAAGCLGLPPEELLMVGDNPARDAFGSLRAGWQSCLVVDRPGGRYRGHRELMLRAAPEIAARIWFAPDLRVLPMALRPAS